MKKENPGHGRYVRRIPISGFASASKEKSGSKKNESKQGKRDLLRLTVRGLYHGAVKMEAEDGSVFTCSKDSARGTL